MTPSPRELLYRWYARRLTASLRAGRLPRHVAVVMDGNRRWARAAGYTDPSIGHRFGAEHVDHLLGWCSAVGIGHVTVYVASADNLRKRGSDEVDHLMRMVEEVVALRLADPAHEWRLHVAGRLDLLPDSTRLALKRAVAETAGRTGPALTVAIGYDGRQEIVDAVRSYVDEAELAGAAPSVAELADRLTPDDIARHLYTSGQPEPDLVIRTSGEQRLSGFLLWQSTQAELYFCDAYWPGFRQVDFLRALRTYARRSRPA
ncbi:polyprenyl diphosphate synthase [Jiangella sp. DSM 45060]|uniref:polyprenyl diphosphate synthase n=1 Tax=Jiangella sp. DSM 45060 TaxID=1798224 RepID=UPI00087925AC|nr:polyprenyl diphosphate synthase [Jiangella sp. DSM 45060]SDS68988.1 Undecaprenyl pyrophosphate synthetase [Jiangella sp. DSM 45060]